MTSTIESRVVTARRPHECSDCGSTINRGDQYRRSAIAGDGTTWTWKEHMQCADDADQMLSDNWFDSDDWPSQWSFCEMQTEMRRPAPDGERGTAS